MTEKQFSKGDVIFKEGDLGECLYKVLEGSVGIYSGYKEAGEQLLTEVKSGRFFGEMAVIEAYPRSATAVALDNVKVCEIKSGEISDLFKNDKDQIVDIMKCLAERLRELTNDYTEVNATIADLRKGEDSKSAGLADRIRKFATVYKRNKTADKLSAEALRKLEQTGHADGYKTRVETYSKGTVIFKEGETGDCMYDIHSGSIGIYKGYGKADEKLLTELMPNQFFGELGMLGDDKRSGTAVVLQDDTTLEIISPADLKDLFGQNPAKVEMILGHISYRLRRLTGEYMNACRILFKVSEDQNGADDRLKEEIKEYKEKLYD